MESLTYETFISAANDIEFSQYQVLASLQKYSELLHRNKLYPTLSELIMLVNLLEDLVNQRSELKQNFPRKLITLDIENNKPIYEQLDYSEPEIKEVFDFINWSLPKIKDVIEEGKAIFDFVDENIDLEEIGLLPIYKNDGYFTIPAHRDGLVQIYRYEMFLYSVKEEPLRTLKTNLIDSILGEESADRTPQSIKLDLMQKYPELPNPAAYCFNTDLDFPFDETILPVAKRKLVQKLVA